MATRVQFNPLSGNLDLIKLELPELSPDPAGTYPLATITLDSRGVVVNAEVGLITRDFSAVYTAAPGSNTIDLGDLSETQAHFFDEPGERYAISLAMGTGTYDLGGL